MNSVLIREHVTEEVYTPPQLVYNMQAEKGITKSIVSENKNQQ